MLGRYFNGICWCFTLFCIALAPVSAGPNGQMSDDRQEMTPVPAKEQMQNMVPILAFKDTNIADVFEFIISGTYSPCVPGSVGVSYIFKAKAGTKRLPKITIDLRRVSLENALGIVCDMGGYKYYYDGEIIMIRHPSEIKKGIRVYPLPKNHQVIPLPASLKLTE